jgi:hypothetical protein
MTRMPKVDRIVGGNALSYRRVDRAMGATDVMAAARFALTILVMIYLFGMRRSG